ncbi:MAG TPA: lipid-A-disaccharide synthase [Patescibacteria group bacterium]|jgi:lipid-A-disaccharide synthase|nr:lipid-A-disaccharide synthase [Patescibacteria group bacterium]
MKARSFMLIAGEASGDHLAAELVQAMRQELAARTVPLTWDYQPLYTSLEPKFFGAGGAQMAAAGVELAFDMTAHSVTGLSDVLRNLLKFRRLFKQLYNLALKREPDAIICVDFSGFNRRFAHAIRQYARAHQDWFHDWNPVIIQYVSPQLWASRENRVHQIAKDFDLVLSIVPFEKGWYQARVPNLPMEFIGHPLVDRYEPVKATAQPERTTASGSTTILVLPGSRPGEITRHLPVIDGALRRIRAELPQVRATMVLPNEVLLARARSIGFSEQIQARIGGLADALRQADLAIASTGTVTLECAYFGVPAVALYKTSWFTWQIASRIATVKYAAMPNLLANEEIFPEFIQDAATPANIANAAVALLRDAARRRKIKDHLPEIVKALGPPGASVRAAAAILEVLESKRPTVQGFGSAATVAQ